MKWFSHDCDSLSNPKIKVLIYRHGITAYGVYFGLLEIIGKEIDGNQEPHEMGLFPKCFPLELLAAEFRIELDKLIKIIDSIADLGLINNEKWSQDKIIFCPKLIQRADDYTRKIIRSKSKQDKDKNSSKLEDNTNNIDTNSGQCPDNVMTHSEKNPSTNTTTNTTTESCLNINTESSKKSNFPVLGSQNTESENKKSPDKETKKEPPAIYKYIANTFHEDYIELENGVKPVWDFKSGKHGKIIKRIISFLDKNKSHYGLTEKELWDKIREQYKTAYKQNSAWWTNSSLSIETISDSKVLTDIMAMAFNGSGSKRPRATNERVKSQVKRPIDNFDLREKELIESSEDFWNDNWSDNDVF